MFTLCPCDKDFISTLEFLLKTVGAIGAFILFWIGLARYRRDQVWKRNEFLANEIKEFNSDRCVINALRMLDWGNRMIELFPDKENYADRHAKVDREILKEALIYHELRPVAKGQQRFTEIEVAIRDAFDRFFYYLERFEQLMVNEIITEEQLYPYMEYLINDIKDGDNGLEPETRKVLFNYIVKYKFVGVQHLLNRYGIQIAV